MNKKPSYGIKERVNHFFIQKKMMNTPIYRLLVWVNYKVYHRGEQEKKVSFGLLNPDRIFCVIRVTDRGGILSTFGTVLSAMKWAEENGYIPVVDMVDEQMRQSSMAFGNYFIQKSEYSLDEVFHSQSVILLGSGQEKTSGDPSFGRLDPEGVVAMRQYIEQRFEFSDDIKEYVNKEETNIDEETLGVFLRGTDYTALQPYYHNRQPSVEDVIGKVKRFLDTHKVGRIYLVTEDETIYGKMKDAFGELVYCTGDHFVRQYDGKAYIANYIDDKYGQNIEYITRIILLSKCRWAIGSVTNGSRVARWLNGAEYEEEEWICDGYYGVPKS